MAEFCSCGSLIIKEKCTNKKCTIKVSGSDAPKSKKTLDKKSTPAKKPRAKRASKVITYNLYETEDHGS